MHILISGAGIAGPTLAWFLAKAGFRATVIEKSSAHFSHGQNVDLKGSALTVIEMMGLMQQVRHYNTKEKGTRFIDSRGNPFAPFPITDGSSASLTSEYEILRGDLAAILYEATKEDPNINYLFNTTIERVISNDDNAVKIELSNGEECNFDLLVAADGQWSKLRNWSFPPESTTSKYLGMYTAYFTVPKISCDDDWWNVYVALGSRVVTLRPDPHGTTRAMFTCMPQNSVQETKWRKASRNGRNAQEMLLREEFADAGWQTPRLLQAMEEAPDFYFHEIQQIRMSSWSKNRIVCLGDAAYAPSPLTGMGTSLAILGAYILAGELSKLYQGEHPSQALNVFERTFRPFVEESQEIISWIPAAMHPGIAWKRFCLQMFLSMLSRIVAIPWVSNQLNNKAKDGEFPLPFYLQFENKDDSG